MNILSVDLITSWVVSLVMMITGIMWLVAKKRTFHIDSSTIGYTLIFWGIVYGITVFFLPVDLQIRAFVGRIVIVVICLSQSIPLTIGYIRSKGMK